LAPPAGFGLFAPPTVEFGAGISLQGRPSGLCWQCVPRLGLPGHASAALVRQHQRVQAIGLLIPFRSSTAVNFAFFGQQLPATALLLAWALRADLLSKIDCLSAFCSDISAGTLRKRAAQPTKPAEHAGKGRRRSQDSPKPEAGADDPINVSGKPLLNSFALSLRLSLLFATGPWFPPHIAYHPISRLTENRCSPVLAWSGSYVPTDASSQPLFIAGARGSPFMGRGSSLVRTHLTCQLQSLVSLPTSARNRQTSTSRSLASGAAPRLPHQPLKLWRRRNRARARDELPEGDGLLLRSRELITRPEMAEVGNQDPP